MSAPNGAATQGSIDGASTLREALSAFVEGAERLSVVDDGSAVGTISFDDVRRAVARTEG
jgi:predicted transcriptional regulator